MERTILCFISLLFLLQCVHGNVRNFQYCKNKTRSCIARIKGQYAELDSCQMEYASLDSEVCRDKVIPINNNVYNTLRLRPYFLPMEFLGFTLNISIINIEFTKIKWKTMKFNIVNSTARHCRNIVIDDDFDFDDETVLYYDCYWSHTDLNYKGRSVFLNFEATDDTDSKSGIYYFNIPTTEMLSSNVSAKDWVPFVYVEKMYDKMLLHIVPPPSHIKIPKYHIQLILNSTEGIKDFKVNETIMANNGSEDTTFEFSLLREPSYFIVTPVHEGCEDNVMLCRNVSSPIIPSSYIYAQTMNICIVSVAALVVAALFAYYIALRLVRRYICKDYSLAIANEIPPPTKVLVIYSPANRLHAECVASFVTYLRFEYGLDVMYDGDISSTSHGDPYIWAEEAIRLSTHVVYVVGPAEETNLYNNIYDKPIITAHKDVDILLLSLLKSTRVSRNPKDVMNVFFEHSNGQLPVETRHDKVYFLLKDWQKLISHLSRHLLPKKQIMRTEKGRSFLEDLTRAKKLLADKKDDVVIKCEKMGSIEKKVLL